MLTLEIMLLVWLQNIYLSPGRITVRLATSKFINGLIDEGYVFYEGKYVQRTYITPKGKRFLMRNIHLIPEDTELFVAPLDPHDEHDLPVYNPPNLLADMPEHIQQKVWENQAKAV